MKGCLVCALESFDSVAVSDYREAIRLSLFYTPSKFSLHTRRRSPELAARWRNVAHQILSDATARLKRGAS